MEIYEVIKNSKNEIALIITWFSWTLTFTLNKMVNWEKVSLFKFIVHLITAWFMGQLLNWLFTEYWISWGWVFFIVWMVWYSSMYLINFINWVIKSLFSLDNATSLWNILFELLKKLWKK